MHNKLFMLFNDKQSRIGSFFFEYAIQAICIKPILREKTPGISISDLAAAVPILVTKLQLITKKFSSLKNELFSSGIIPLLRPGRGNGGPQGHRALPLCQNRLLLVSVQHSSPLSADFFTTNQREFEFQREATGVYLKQSTCRHFALSIGLCIETICDKNIEAHRKPF